MAENTKDRFVPRRKFEVVPRWNVRINVLGNCVEYNDTSVN